MIVNENLEISEQEDGTYVTPVSTGNPKYTWALYVFKKSNVAHLYTRRNEDTGALLGKPLVLLASKKELRIKHL